MSEQEKQIILTLCERNMKIAETARELNYNRQTIRYHLDKIKKRTGLDPMVFNDLVKLREEVNTVMDN